MDLSTLPDFITQFIPKDFMAQAEAEVQRRIDTLKAELGAEWGEALDFLRGQVNQWHASHLDRCEALDRELAKIKAELSELRGS